MCEGRGESKGCISECCEGRGECSEGRGECSEGGGEWEGLVIMWLSIMTWCCLWL